MQKNIGAKGQFFSPDLIVAVIVFCVSLLIFFSVSTSNSYQIDLFERTSRLQESAHASMNSLVLSQGSPIDWDEKNIQDVNVFGLAKETSVLDWNKIIALGSFLDNDYLTTKQALGLGALDFSLEVIDFNGSTLFSKGRIADDFTHKEVDERIVSINGRQSLLRGVFSYEE